MGRSDVAGRGPVGLFNVESESELRRLAWGDVHLDGMRGAIYFPAHKAKSRKDAAVPLTEDLRSALVSARPRRRPGRRS